MKITIDLEPSDAVTFERFLNDDGGLREGAVQQLLMQHKPPNIEEWTAIVAALGAISRGITTSDGFERGTPSQRRKDIKKLARLN